MKSAIHTLIMRIMLVVTAMLPLGACIPSYTLNGAAIDYSVYKTIYVSQFPIRAALVYPPLQQTFENELLDYIARNTRLTNVESNADVQDQLCQEISKELVDLIFNATLGDW